MLKNFHYMLKISFSILIFFKILFYMTCSYLSREENTALGTALDYSGGTERGHSSTAKNR